MKRSRLRTLVAISFVSGGLTILVACEDDTAAPPATPTLDGSSPGFDSSPVISPGTDSAAPVDSGEISDGGENPVEEDGGITTDEDGGFDAGPTCGQVNVGAYATTTCSALRPSLKGGDLATGTYLLEGAVILGSTVFCSRGGTYVPYDYRGGLRVTATSATAATFEFLEQHKQTNVATRLPTTVRYDVAVAATAETLTFTPQACSRAAPAAAAFTAATNAGGKKTLTLQLPLGRTGSVLLRFVEP